VLTVADLFWIAVVVMIATAIGSRFRQQITSGMFAFLASLWALSYVGMVAFLVYRWYFPARKPNPATQVVDAYLGSWWGLAAVLIALGWWARRWYVERARGQYVTGLIEARAERLRAAGVEGYPLHSVAGVDDWEDDASDDGDDDGPPDPEYARRTAQMETARRWAHATTYGLVVVPLFVLMLFK
jgi:hypothetical protein